MNGRNSPRKRKTGKRNRTTPTDLIGNARPCKGKAGNIELGSITATVLEEDEIGLLVRITNNHLDTIDNSLQKLRHAEGQLKEYNDRLAQIVEARTSEIRDKNEALQRSNRALIDAREEALDMLGKAQHNLVLMDCQMPVMDGFEATAAIRRTPGIQDLPVIAVTANAMQGDREGCLEAGMDDYLTKPYSLAAMKQVLERWMPERETR